MIVYHGSDVRIEKIDLLKSKDLIDFGKGFYVTNIRKHAHRRALRMAEENGTSPVITEFEYHEFYPESTGLQLKRFPDISEEWVHFVIMNRDKDIRKPAHAYDIVEGPIADDWVTSQINNYKKGKIHLEQLLERLRYKEPTHQICFCTPESLFALEQVGFDDIYNTEEITNAIVEAMMTDYNIDEKTAMDRLYLTGVYRHLADMDTALYLKSWQEIYEMIKKELSQ
jgi:hypothetical protein